MYGERILRICLSSKTNDDVLCRDQVRREGKKKKKKKKKFPAHRFSKMVEDLASDGYQAKAV